MLLDYVLRRLKETGKLTNKGFVVKSFVTTSMANLIANDYGVEIMETPVGFKFIGEQAKLIENTEKSFFFGYEESYGSVIKPFVRDKDSFQATLLLAEVASYYKEQGKTLVNVLDEISIFFEILYNSEARSIK